MKETIYTLTLGLGLLASSASAALVVNIQGAPGKGYSVVSFSGSSVTGGTHTFATTGTPGYNAGDTFQALAIPGVWTSDTFMATRAIQDELYDWTGVGSVTVDGVTRQITQIFLDEDHLIDHTDGTVRGWGGPDDFGIRLDAKLSYTTGLPISWTGSGQIPLDITNFNPGKYYNNHWHARFALFEYDSIILNVAVVPEPSTYIAMVGFGLLGFFLWRRRRANTNAEAPVSVE